MIYNTRIQGHLEVFSILYSNAIWCLKPLFRVSLKNATNYRHHMVSETGVVQAINQLD